MSTASGTRDSYVKSDPGARPTIHSKCSVRNSLCKPGQSCSLCWGLKLLIPQFPSSFAILNQWNPFIFLHPYSLHSQEVKEMNLFFLILQDLKYNLISKILWGLASIFFLNIFFLLMVHHVGTGPLHWKCRILTTGPPGKTHPFSFSVLSYFSFLSSTLASSVLCFLPFAFPGWPFHPSLPFRLQGGQTTWSSVTSILSELRTTKDLSGCPHL